MSDEFITPEEFCDAWKKVWADKDENQKLSNQFTGDGTWGEWTKCMLGSKDDESESFLECVVKEVMGENPYGCEHEGSIRVDLRVVADKNKGYPNSGYPFLLDILIEHENDKCPENEMWKLMLLRSPLKVIIFYDHCKVELPVKLKELREMLTKANAAFPENENTKYLFIIGSGNVKGEKMRWQWATDKEQSPQNLC